MSLVAGTPAERTDNASPELTRFPGPGAISVILAGLLAVFVRPVIALFARFPNARWPFGWVDRAALLLPRPRRVTRRQVVLPHCRAELLTPRTALGDPTSVLLYLHGGGFITCGLRTHRRLVADVARAAGQPALAIDYRQLPQHGLSEALDDAVDGFRALLARGYAPGDISIVGDSAGGYLTVATALTVARLGLGQPAAAVLMSPMTSVDPNLPVADGARDPLLTGASVAALSRKLATKPGPPGAALPLPRLAGADLTGLPPTLIQVGTREVLRDGAEELATGIAAAGVPCELQVWEGQFHVFQAAAPVLAPARRAVAEIGDFLRRTRVGVGGGRR
ncbi:alpha/beta hydrolase [Mycobacterium sp. pUA109]|uniref:alpha/beta hydrolase n=1 Tax=Mycobacterium sp. pUA109 TaxID=3238982 RepID=UPI00351BA272